MSAFMTLLMNKNILPCNNLSVTINRLVSIINRTVNDLVIECYY